MEVNESLSSTTEEKKVERKASGAPTVEHAEGRKHGIYDVEGASANRLGAVFENPLAGIPRDQLFADVDRFCHDHKLEDYRDTFRKGALLSQNPRAAEALPELTESEREAIIRERTHKWSQPWMLYFLAGMRCYLSPTLAVSVEWLTILLQPCAPWRRRFREWTRRSTTGRKPSISR